MLILYTFYICVYFQERHTIMKLHDRSPFHGINRPDTCLDAEYEVVLLLVSDNFL